MQTRRTIRAVHAGVVAAIVAVGIYVYVPQLDSVLKSFGQELPLSTRILLASYPFAFVLPMLAGALGFAPAQSSPWRWIVVPSVYVLAFAIVCFIVWASYAPAFAITEGR